MMRALRGSVAFVLLLVAAAASAFQTFQIDEIYSTADGAVQYVVLRETAGMNNQDDLAGHSLAVTSGGVTKTFVFPSNLPNSSTANTRVLIATQDFASLGLVAPDYVIPAQFLPVFGGTLNYAGVDQIAFGVLPVDGIMAASRSGAPTPNFATNFAGTSASVPPLPVTAVEYYAASLDHYFISALQPDIDALDNQRIPGWQRTGQSFLVYPSPAAADLAVSPVCRFYIPPQHGDSHFFSASPAECNLVLQKVGTDPNYSGFVYETANAFFIDLPNVATGACPPLTTAVFRLWNNRADTNHRYTTSPATEAQMQAKGYIAEGYGNNPVAMCAPTGQTIDRTTLNLNALTWTGTEFIAVAGQAGTAAIVTSADGLTWTARNAGQTPFRGIGWSGTLAVIVGTNGTVLTSPDGLVWTPQVTNSIANLNAVAWVGTEFVVVGDGGVILISSDGVNWTLRPSKTMANLYAIMQSGLHVFIAGAGGTILSSNDGTTWAPTTSGTANNLFGFTQTASKLFAVGANGTIIGSSDNGKTWSPSTSNTSATLSAATWSGTTLVAVGSGGRIVTSFAGTVWNVQHTGVAETLNDVSWSGSQFVAVGDSGRILTSPDGVTWTAR
jgi:hypothetical protein